MTVEREIGNTKFIFEPDKNHLYFYVWAERSGVLVSLLLDKGSLCEIIGLMEKALKSGKYQECGCAKFYFEDDGYTLCIEQGESLINGINITFGTPEEVNTFLSDLKLARKVYPIASAG